MRDIEAIRRDPFALWVCVGDYCDFISPSDKRFDPASVDATVTINDLTSYAYNVSNQIAELFSPIAGKCIGFGLGNHDLKYLSRNSEMYIHQSICDRLNTRNLMYSGWADLYFVYDPALGRPRMTYGVPEQGFNLNRSRLRILTFHGRGAAATAGGKLNALKSVVDMVETANLIITGHLHEQIMKCFPRLNPGENCDGIQANPVMALITGTYLRTYMPEYVSYGEQKAYPPTTLGATRARYIPSTLTLTVENRADGVGVRG